MEHQRSSPAWWALALSEEVTGEKPLAVRCGPDEVVLFRDKSGAVRAFEDRCPHRRVPLSLGRMKDGALQCGYHGWTFEGATGRCIDIPNLDADEKVPERYGVPTYALDERDGFVYVWIGGSPQGQEAPTVKVGGGGREFTGSTTVAIPHDEFVAAIFDGPQILFDFSTVRLTDFLLGDPAVIGEHLVLERGAGWKGPHFPDRFVPDWPLVLRTSLAPATGQTLVEVRDGDDDLLISGVVASAPAARGATTVRWRCRTAPQMGGAAAALTRGLAQLGKSPFGVKPFVDGAALASLRPGPSHVWRAATRVTSKGLFAAA